MATVRLSQSLKNLLSQTRTIPIQQPIRPDAPVRFPNGLDGCAEVNNYPGQDILFLNRERLVVARRDGDDLTYQDYTIPSDPSPTEPNVAQNAKSLPYLLIALASLSIIAALGWSFTVFSGIDNWPFDPTKQSPVLEQQPPMNPSPSFSEPRDERALPQFQAGQSLTAADLNGMADRIAALEAKVNALTWGDILQQEGLHVFPTQISTTPKFLCIIYVQDGIPIDITNDVVIAKEDEDSPLRIVNNLIWAERKGDLRIYVTPGRVDETYPKEFEWAHD